MRLPLVYENNVFAQLTSSMRMYKPCEAFVVGSNGYIKVHDIFFCPDTLTLYQDSSQPETTQFPYIGNGYAHEVVEVHACL